MADMDITFLGAVAQIGGNKFLLSDGVDEDSRILLDFGMQFGDPKSFAESDRALAAMGAFFDEFLQPRTNARLRDLLALGILPRVDGLYREDWLVSPGFEAAVADHLGDVPYRDFWATDLESYQAYKQRTGRPFVDGVLITHAHADHFQHLAFVDPEIPVYCTAVTRSIIKSAGEVGNQSDTAECYEARLHTAMKRADDKAAFPGSWSRLKANDRLARDGGVRARERPFHIVEPFVPFRVGAFEATAIPIDHSVPGACFFLIKGQDGKRVLYTGDFRFHGVYEHASTAAKQMLDGARPDAMLCEGTRIDNDHTVYEEDVLRTTKQTMKAHRGLILAEWGWKDATRFLTMQQAAAAAGRTLLVDSRLAYMLHHLSKVDPSHKPIEAYDNVKVYLRRRDSLSYSPQDHNKMKHELGYATVWDAQMTSEAKAWYVARRFDEDGAPAPLAMVHYQNGVRADEVRKAPHRYVVQSSFFQMTELIDLQPPSDSYYIKSSCEPFNDEMVSDQLKHTNWLDRWGIGSNIHENAEGHHTSGHASGPELAEFWRIVRPETLVPIHTQRPERYQELWERGNVQIPKYAETITI